MKAATCGVFPETGFLGEEFDKKSHRYRLRGQKICNGWRPIMFCENVYVQLFDYFVFNVLGTWPQNHVPLSAGRLTILVGMMLKLELKQTTLNATTAAGWFVSRAWLKTTQKGQTPQCGISTLGMTGHDIWLTLLTEPTVQQPWSCHPGRKLMDGLWGHVCMTGCIQCI